MILNCITIDDEPPALDLINRFVNQTPFLKLVGSFENAIEALKFIKEEQVDVIFSDIQMPDLSGVELARILSGRHLPDAPAIIFTTAYDQYALEGYKLDIIDYLLKPLNYEDFMRAAVKASKLTSSNNPPERFAVKTEEFIYLKVEFQTVKIACSSINYIEGLKDYAKIYLLDTDKPILSLITLKSLEEKLPQNEFMRIHKSTIISLNKVTAVTKSAVYIGQTLLQVSEQYKADYTRFAAKWI